MKHKKFVFFTSLTVFCIFLSGIIIGLGEVLISRNKQSEEALLYNAMHTSGSLIAQNIQRNIASGIYATETIHNLLESNNYSVEYFEDWGRQIVEGNKNASTVQLAPDGIVTYIYPLKGNEGAMGHDLLRDKRRDDGALKTLQSKELTFIGPVKLIQNNKYAVIARKPVFQTTGQGIDEFWGFSIALLLVEDLISKETYDNIAEGMHIRLEGDDPDAETNPVFISSGDEEYERGISIRISVPNGNWLLTINHEPIKNRNYTLFRTLIITLALLTSIYIFFQQYRLRSKSMEITLLNEKLSELSLVDDLTGAGNRRAGMKILGDLISQSNRYSTPLSIIMSDIDFFKEVNDNYGHPAGDRVLQYVVKGITSTLRKSDSIFRLGGDEFFIIFPQTDVEHCHSAAKKIVNYLKENPFKFENNSIPVNMSIGIAELYEDDTIESIIYRADQMLYKAKRDGRNCIRYN